MVKEDIIGCTTEPEEDYDLIEIIEIRRGDEPSSEGILDYLDCITQANLPKIRNYSNVEWSEQLKDEGQKVAGFADSLLRRTKKESREAGKEEEMQQNGLSAETISQYLNKSVDVVKSLML